MLGGSISASSLSKYYRTVSCLRFTVLQGRVIGALSGGFVVAARAPVPHIVRDSRTTMRARQDEVDVARNVLTFDGLVANYGQFSV